MKFINPGCILLTSFILAACTAPGSSYSKRATCNRLKSSIVFSSATSNTREANIQRAEKPLQEHDYDAYNCGDSYLNGAPNH